MPAFVDRQACRLLPLMQILFGQSAAAARDRRRQACLPTKAGMSPLQKKSTAARYKNKRVIKSLRGEIHYVRDDYVEQD